MDLAKAYNSKEVEDKIYKLWEKSGFFNPDNLPVSKIKNKKLKIKNFSIIMPPPNANGALHIGHALFVALEDLMIRYRRMKGDKTLWLPGADHAGFETQVVFDKKLEKEGRSRFQIPPEQLYQEILEFTLANKEVMQNQLRKLGASCDWSREKFTLDPEIIKIVYQTFEKLKKDGLIYKGKRIVNWCVKHQTSLSDLEVKYQEQTDPLYFIKYGPLELATVRLETKFGDTAVAVNPKDKRYQEYIGKEIEIETLLGPKKMKVIADQAVDPEFGTGVVKVTPAHDLTDFEIWQRHEKEIPGPLEAINKFGKLTEIAGPYQGMKVLEARKKIAQDMAEKGLLNPAKTDHNYKHNVATCYKCGSLIEPMILDNQYFVKMAPLRDLAVKAVKNKKIKFIPQRFEKIFFHWMKNLKDWNISRQIVWGIKIPEKDTKDVFDTWFSSGQWPFATLKAGSKKDFETFYPTNVMETGHDILFFWVARMIMLGLYVTGKVPFKYVYLHGLVRDKERQKMSKSKGNVIDPLGVIDLYGSDALRMALTVGNTPGSDPIISEEKIRGYRNFANKIWNASRFVAMQTISGDSISRNYDNVKRSNLKKLTDKKCLNDLNKITKEITKLIDSFKFYRAAEKIYHYFWHTFCDKIIEDRKKGKVSQKTLLEILKTNLKLLHPFMPFVTEEIYQKLPIKNKKKCLMIERWPI